MAMILKTPETFYNTYNGKAIDDDGAYGVQCVDGIRVGCKYLSIPVIPTPNNWADGYWTCLNADGTPSQKTAEWQEKYFEKIRDPKQFKDGDWVIWGRGSVSHPSSHVAMYYHGEEFGERQGGDRSFCLRKTDFNDALGALRPKAWSYVEIPFGASTLEVGGNKYFLYRQNPATETFAVLSAGLNKVLPITKLDANVNVMSKITGANYFQLSEGSNPQNMTYGDLSSPLNAVWQELPNQNSTLFFDMETGAYGDCTGIHIDRTHNVFSPGCVYPHAGNYQYGTFIGIDCVNVVSRYTFSIRLTDGSYILGLADQDSTPKAITTDFRNSIEFDSIAFLDGGGSAQMMRYIASEHRVEYTRETPRAVPSAVAIIEKKSLTVTPVPVQPTEPETEPSEDEDKKDEEDNMSENKTQEQPQIELIEGWSDPEQKDSIIVQRIASLMSVKSIITIALTVAFIMLVVNGKDLPDDFVNIYTMCISFFFGYQFKKAENSEK